MTFPEKLKARQRLGKYRIDRKLSEGSFAHVYQAYDSIEGIAVALKIPHIHLMNRRIFDFFRKEVRLTAHLDHPNILPIKNASYIEGRFVIVYPLGKSSLALRLRKRLTFKSILDYSEQILHALAHAHKEQIIHCDVKPENIIVFPSSRLRLADFGIARVAKKTIQASGSGTLGYMAPEQAMGRASFRSDVFSAALVIYKMFTGQLPEWPFRWPLAGHQRLRSRLHPEVIDWLRRCLEVDQKKRYESCDTMLKAFLRLRSKALRYHQAKLRRRAQLRS